MKALIYDIEIVKAIPQKNEPPVSGVEYCGGWSDHANMGVSVIGAYDYETDRYRTFCADNWSQFFILAQSRLLVGFNSIAFDTAVLSTFGDREAAILEEARHYDLLVELWAAEGLGSKFQYPSHTGYGLDATCSANFGTNKTGDGGHAPVDWQRGKIGSVIDYCLNDIKLTKQLFDHVIARNVIKSPKTGKPLVLRQPFA